MFHLKPLTEPSGISMEELIDETVTVDPELFKVFGEQQDIHVCSETLVYQNKTSIGFLYGGIPETLVINICVWLVSHVFIQVLCFVNRIVLNRFIGTYGYYFQKYCTSLIHIFVEIRIH